MDVSAIHSSVQAQLTAQPPADQIAERRELVRAANTINASQVLGGENELVFVLDRTSHRAIMRVVDRDFRSILGARCFMTAMCVALNPTTGAASIVGAGHPPLLVARRSGETESIASSSPPLGLVSRSSFTETPLQLAAGDLFLLYTDGLYGSANGAHRRLTPSSLAKRLHSASGSAESLLHRLCREALPSGNGDIPADDIAALAVRRHPERN